MHSSLRSRALLVLMLLGALAVSSCGGGGGEAAPVAPVPQPVTIQISSTAGMDGYISNLGNVSTVFGLLCGDIDASSNGEGFHSYLTFPLGAIPAGATIDRATLSVYQVEAMGDPFTNHDLVYAFRTDYGDTLDAADYFPGADNGLILSDTTAVGWRTVAMTAAVQNTWGASGPRIQFMLKNFTSSFDTDSVDDYIRYEAADNYWNTGNTPILSVTYTLPSVP